VDSWKLLDSSLLISRVPWLSVYRESVRLPSGRVLDDFYRVVLPEFAMVVALTAEEQLVMVRGYKHGLKRVCLSAPGGLVEFGESPLEAGQRELLEETGYQAAEWQSLGTFVGDGNRQCGTAHIFLARGAVQVKSCNQGDGTEEVEVVLMPPQRFLQAIHEGDIALLATVSAVALGMVHLART
jgi:ADP-ribose pyrophosphatase